MYVMCLGRERLKTQISVNLKIMPKKLNFDYAFHLNTGPAILSINASYSLQWLLI